MFHDDLYGDDGSDCVYYAGGDSNASTASVDRDEAALEDFTEEYEDQQLMDERAYVDFFCDETSLFRERFPQEYDSEEGCYIADLSGLLATAASPSSASQPLTHDICGGDDGNASPTISPAPSNAVLPTAVTAAAAAGSALVGTEVVAVTGDTVRLKESPATKRLKGGAIGVVLSIPRTMNRAELQGSLTAQSEELQSKISPDAVFVGYFQRDSVGLGLVLFNDAADAECCCSRIPEARLFNPETDMRWFYREEFIRSSKLSFGSGAPQGPPPQQPPVALHRSLAAQLVSAMADVSRLETLIDSFGGVKSCHFVAFDCEAAVVKEGANPLPLELAFVCCDMQSDSFFNFHTFVHPGTISDNDISTARKLSMCMVPGGHGIPYKCAKFLRYDYTRLARVLWSITMDPARRVVLINKGSVMDVQAIRWVFAAGEYLHRQGDDEPALAVPGILDIPMFDIDTLEKFALQRQQKSSDHAAAGVEVPRREQNDDESVSGEGCCWYHEAMCDVLPRAHCAVADARKLALRTIDALGCL